MKRISAIASPVILLCFGIAALPKMAWAQNAPSTLSAQAASPAPPTNSGSFSLTAQAVALPGGGQTVAATDVGFTKQITANFSLRDDNVLAPANGLQFYGGGGNYFVPTGFLKKTKLNPSDFQPYVTACLGVDRIVPATGPSRQHIGFLIGGGLNYKATNGVWVNLFEARYAKLPGMANNTAIISSGFSLNF